MSDATPTTQPECSWADRVRIIGRTFHLAGRWPRPFLALAALILILLWGGLLDRVWLAADGGVAAGALAAFLTDTPSDGPEDDVGEGVFSTWRRHQMICMDRAAVAVCQGRVFGGLGRDPGSGERRGSLSPTALYDRTLVSGGVLFLIGQMAYGVGWMFSERPCFAAFFWLGTIALSALTCGALCRQMALDLTRGEHPTLRQTFDFVKSKYWGGFLAAPLLPAVLALVVVLVMGIFGLGVLRIPVLGDLVGGPLFVVFLFLGSVAALLGLCTVLCGGLFWPAIAMEGTDAFDAVSRSFPYACGKLWKAAIYAIVMLIYGSVCWMAVRVVGFSVLWMAHSGMSLFGTGGTILTDGFAPLAGVWQAPTLANFYPADMNAVGFFESFCMVTIKLWVLLILGLVWAFPISFYFAAHTVVYVLLRRDVDATAFDEVFIEEYQETPAAKAPA